MKVKNNLKWGKPITSEDLEKTLNVKRKITGLGDVVEIFAQPVAKAIDAVAKTNIQKCGGCKKRKEFLNKKFTFIPIKK
jgi:hypothetical protein